MGRIQQTVAWMLVLPSTVSWTELGAQEWRDYLFLRYGINPTDLLSHYNGCGAELSIYHTLNFKKGGLITARHNELRDRVANLAGQASIPAHVHNDPKIFTSCTVQGGEANTKGK